MIVWLASYPRSGNTFLRIALNRLYGLRTSVIYPVDGVADRLGSDLVGAGEGASDPARLRAADGVHVVKTHRQRDDQVDGGDAALCLARDGRDALVSFARQRTEADPTRFADELQALIHRHDAGTGSWGQNVISWLQPSTPDRVLIRYDDLIRHPRETVTGAIARVAPHLTPTPSAAIPTFADLHRIDASFFRRGRTGTHRSEMPADLEELFWSYSDNVEAMQLLGYRR